jgi:iron complex outermembrane receptor protein
MVNAMRKPSALSAAISGILFGAAMAPQGVAVAQEQGDSEVLEEIITTGSRIVRTDKFDTAGHVINVDEQQIDALAVLNIADVLRSSPLNAYGSFNERSGNSAGSNATFDLRGLGSSRTLVLFDAMRVPGSPNLGAASVNINMLPMVAVQRIDILADGASAVYGSDALAGVVNVVPHHDFEGIEVSMRYGDRDLDDGGDESIGILAGAANDRGNVVFAFEYSHRDAVFDVDRSYTAPWIVDDGDGEIHAYSDTDGISYYGRSWELFDDMGTEDAADDFFEYRAAADCPTTGGFMGVMGAEALGDPDGTLCTFAYAGVSANRAELTKVNSYMYASYELSDNVEMYARALFSENKSFGRYAPPAAGWNNPPIGHAHNPYDIEGMIEDGTITEDYELWAAYRWTNIGTRDDYTTDNQWDAVLGFKGDITDEVSFDFYYQSGEYNSRSLGNYYLSYTGLAYVLAENIDPFSATGAAAMRATPTQDNVTKQNRASASVQFGTMEMGGGDAIALIGAEWADIEFVNQYDAASEGGFIGGSAGNSSFGERDFYSIFGEYLMPISDSVELNLAVRYDDYSDFGTATSPSLSVNWNATDTLALRARWGEGFKAPALSSLYGPETFSAETAYDPITGTRRQFDTYFNVNPDLGAESSESYSVGANWEYIEGHSIDLAYYNVNVTDVISFPGAQSLLYADAFGVSFDPNGSRVERTGLNVSQIFSFGENGDELEVNGIDFQLHSMFDTGIGVFDANVFYSHQLNYKVNAYFRGGFQDTAGFFLQPTDRGQGSLSWNLGDHAVDLIVDYIGPHSEEDNLDEATGVLTTSSNDLDSWTTMNLAYRFDAGTLGQIKVGANNITNEDPVLDIEGKYSDGFPDIYDALGRVVYVEYRKSWE